MLDPIADKLLIGAVLIMLVKLHKANEIPCILILMREFFIAGLREFLAEIRVSVPVSNLAKVKTFMQMTALFLLLLGSTGSKLFFVDSLGHIALWISALLTLITGYAYFRAALRYF
jgi:CDP-diacylglycerol--glycerol-3-phosphate 3-phosphatidyltransferase